MGLHDLENLSKEFLKTAEEGFAAVSLINLFDNKSKLPVIEDFPQLTVSDIGVYFLTRDYIFNKYLIKWKNSLLKQESEVDEAIKYQKGKESKETLEPLEDLKNGFKQRYENIVNDVLTEYSKKLDIMPTNENALMDYNNLRNLIIIFNRNLEVLYSFKQKFNQIQNLELIKNKILASSDIDEIFSLISEYIKYSIIKNTIEKTQKLLENVVSIYNAFCKNAENKINLINQTSGSGELFILSFYENLDSFSKKIKQYNDFLEKINDFIEEVESSDYKDYLYDEISKNKAMQNSSDEEKVFGIKKVFQNIGPNVFDGSIIDCNLTDTISRYVNDFSEEFDKEGVFSAVTRYVLNSGSENYADKSKLLHKFLLIDFKTYIINNFPELDDINNFSKDAVKKIEGLGRVVEDAIRNPTKYENVDIKYFKSQLEELISSKFNELSNFENYKILQPTIEKFLKVISSGVLSGSRFFNKGNDLFAKYAVINCFTLIEKEDIEYLLTANFKIEGFAEELLKLNKGKSVEKILDDNQSLIEVFFGKTLQNYFQINLFERLSEVQQLKNNWFDSIFEFEKRMFDNIYQTSKKLNYKNDSFKFGPMEFSEDLEKIKNIPKEITLKYILKYRPDYLSDKFKEKFVFTYNLAKKSFGKVDIVQIDNIMNNTNHKRMTGLEDDSVDSIEIIKNDLKNNSNLSENDIEEIINNGSLITNGVELRDSIRNSLIKLKSFIEKVHNFGIKLTKDQIIQIIKSGFYKQKSILNDKIINLIIKINNYGGINSLISKNQKQIKELKDKNLISENFESNLLNFINEFNSGKLKISQQELRKLEKDFNLIIDFNQFKSFYNKASRPENKKNENLFKLNKDINDYLRFRVLPDLDFEYFQVGAETDCCQTVGGAGEDALIDSFINPLAGVIVLEVKENGGWNIVAQSYFHYVPSENGFILDNIEAAPRYKNGITSPSGNKILLQDIYAYWAKEKSVELKLPYLDSGKGYSDLDSRRFDTKSRQSDPRSFSVSDPYSDYSEENSIDLLKPNFEPSDISKIAKLSTAFYKQASKITENLGNFLSKNPDQYRRMEEIDQKSFEKYKDYDYSQSAEDIEDDFYQKGSNGVGLLDDSGNIVGYIYGYKMTKDEIPQDLSKDFSNQELIDNFGFKFYKQVPDKFFSKLMKSLKNSEVFYVSNLALPVNKHKLPGLINQLLKNVKGNGYKFISMNALSDSMRLFLTPEMIPKVKRIEGFGLDLVCIMPEETMIYALFEVK